MRLRKFIIAFVVFVSLYTQKLQAQELFYKVYQFETPFEGHTEISLWNTFIANSNQSYEHFNKTIPNQNLFAHSLEVEYGLADHLELDAYTDFENAANDNFKFIRTHFSALYRFGERYDHFINIALYAEYYLLNQSYESSQEAELRLILDKDLGDFRIVLNPTLSKYTTGDADKDLQPGLAAAVYYRRGFRVQPGVEYYSNFKEKTGVILPTLNVNITPAIMWNIAAGFGLTNESDNLFFKSILTFDIRAVRPSKLFRRK